MQRSDILVIAATARELARPGNWRTLSCGVGPVDAAAATAAAIENERPSAIVHVGIAGARSAASIPAGTIVIGSASRYSDLSVPQEWAPSIVHASAALVNALQLSLPQAITRMIGTSAHVGGTNDCDIEAMEGFAVLRAAQLAQVPAIEVRAISNVIEETDRALWHFDTAFDAITSITPTLVDAVCAHLNMSREV